MDSHAVNKLIRSEIWPVLRAQGFTGFAGRSAFRYLPFLIHVVNFQNFNSHLAQRLGCTTFSFAMNLGVYVIGSQNESRIRRDKKGSLRPKEFECSFRARLEKRSSIDGFDRAGLFFIDVNGRTAAACIEEARSLLTDVAPLWFNQLLDVSQILASFENGRIGNSPDHVEPVYFGNRGSIGWHETLSTLRLAQHSSDPTYEHQEALREEAGKLFGAYLGVPLTLSSALLVERQVHRASELLNGNQRIFASPRFKAEVDLKMAVKQQIWPLLKEHGFSEFTTRLARRTVGQVFQMVEVAPPSSMDRMLSPLELGSFHVQLGVLWPLLPVGRHGARNLPLTPLYSNIATWLQAPGGEPASIEVARDCLKHEGLAWLSMLTDSKSALLFLQKSDLDLFALTHDTQHRRPLLSATIVATVVLRFSLPQQ